MADTIESFVEKLHEEGVEAGKAEARRIVDQARAEAEKIIADATAQAERIGKDARAQAERTLKQGRDELELASRDVLLRLRDTISRSLEAVLRHAASEAMKDEAFLKNLLHDVVVQYARKDAEGARSIEINVSKDVVEDVAGWAIHEMTHEGDEPRTSIDLKGKLETAGFEYRASGGNVEVTPESVAAVLSEMIAPWLREVIDQAAPKERD